MYDERHLLGDMAPYKLPLLNLVAELWRCASLIYCYLLLLLLLSAAALSLILSCFVCLCTDMEQAAWSAVPGLEGGQNEQNKKQPDSSMSVWYLMSARRMKISVVFHFAAA